MVRDVYVYLVFISVYYVNVNMEPRFKKEDLLKAAVELGHPVSDRLLDEWVKAGLIDQPRRRGLGRGRGIEATWPESQLRLFRTVLGKKYSDRVKRIPTLCNIPVFIWLYWGEEFVPTRQVRRALGTWSGAHRRGSMRAAMYTARQVAAQFDSPQARPQDRNKLIEAIARVGMRGRIGEEERDELRRAFLRVFDPWGERGAVGPQGARLTADSWLILIEARLAASANYGTLTDENFLRVRALHASAMQSYIVEQPAFALDPDIGAQFEAPTADMLANNACQHLLTMLGMETLKAQRESGHD